MSLRWTAIDGQQLGVDTIYVQIWHVCVCAARMCVRHNHSWQTKIDAYEGLLVFWQKTGKIVSYRRILLAKHTQHSSLFSIHSRKAGDLVLPQCLGYRNDMVCTGIGCVRWAGLTYGTSLQNSIRHWPEDKLHATLTASVHSLHDCCSIHTLPLSYFPNRQDKPLNEC